MDNQICKGCGEPLNGYDSSEDYTAYGLCAYCSSIYENTTGYCSLDCCLGRGCDGSC